MKTKRKLLIVPFVIVTVILIVAGIFSFLYVADWGFSREIPFSEQLRRLHTVHTAEKRLGIREGFSGHEEILQIYNNHKPLAQGYMVTANDSWCAAFASSVAIECDMTDIIPTECGCERHIALFQELGAWYEQDDLIPLPGDLIFYDWNTENPGESTGWSDHVGIVVGTAGPFIKVIEGNRNDSVTYRIILRGDYRIRGFGLPDYASKLP